jgi:hypothetical protein
MTFVDGRWVAIIRWILFHLVLGQDHQVRQLVDNDDQVRHRNRPLLAGLGVLAHELVVGFDVADLPLGEEAIPLLHDPHRVAKGEGRFLGIADDRRDEVGDAVIAGEFHHLRVDHEELDLVRRGIEENAADHGVDHDALARSGGPGDENVGHLGQVARLGMAEDVLAESDGQLGFAGAELLGEHDVLEMNQLSPVVGDFDADHGFSGDGTDDPHGDGAHGQGQVVGEVDDAVDLDTRRRLELVHGDNRAGVHLCDLSGHAEIGELSFQDA